jgi:glycosyltransferase involved in cell wall biosynthesis
MDGLAPAGRDVGHVRLVDDLPGGVFSPRHGAISIANADFTHDAPEPDNAARHLACRAGETSASGTMTVDEAQTAMDLSVVVPAYNEEVSLRGFLAEVDRVLARITQHYEIVCVDDGSADRTWTILQDVHRQNPRVKAVRFSRNFGKEAALTAGLSLSTGRAVIPMDADHQHPPELIPVLVEKWREGHDVVLASVTDRSEYSAPRRIASRLFYRVMNWTGDVTIPSGVGDFRLMDRRVVNALQLLPERTRFMKGIFAWLGFDQVTVPYRMAARSAGASKWGFWSLVNFGIEGIASFSTLPLRIWSYLGVVFAVIAILYAFYITFQTLIYGVAVPGYASLMTALLFLNGLVMISLGVLGEYVGRVFIEVKQRPLYLISESFGFDKPQGFDRR